MKRKKNFSIPPKYMLLVGLILCAILIFVSFRYKDQMSSVKTAVGTVFTPMQKGINQIGTYISNKLEQFQMSQKLLQENEILKEELDTITYENKILQQDKYELESLRELYKLDQKYPSYPKVAAKVISNDPSNWYNTFTIDKGRDDGLAVDMNVMAGNGLVGIITEVGANYAKVRSIIDDNSNVSGMFLKTADTCNVKGNLTLMDEGFIEVEIDNKDAKILDNYEVVTSYMSPKYLQGILIGYVSNVTVDSNNMTKSGYLTPVVDFKRLDTVLVITELKEELKE